MAKQCPNCNGFALYEDTLQTCPVCNGVLVTYQRTGAARPAGGAGAARPAGSAGAARPAGSAGATRPAGGAGATRPTGGAGAARPAGSAGQTAAQPQPPAFRTELGGRQVQFRGTIREVTHSTRLHSRFKKIVNSVFQREPYQLGHTSHYTTLRIEEYHPGMYAGNTIDVIFYGDVEGRVYRGDDVTVTTKRIGDRYVVTRLERNDGQGEVVQPTPQMSAGLIIALILLAIGLPVGFVAGGGLTALAGALVNLAGAILPTAVTIGLAVYILYKIIRPD